MLAQTVLSFAIGLGAILVAAKIFLALSQEWAATWKLSPLFIAVVIIALGTTLPELTVTIASVAQNDPGLAMGNIIGSSVTNITLILGMSILFGGVKLGTNKTQVTAKIFAAVVAIFILLQLSSLSAEIQGLALLVTLGAALCYEFILALNGRVHEDKKFLQRLSLHKKKRKFTGVIGVVALLSSVAGLGIGGMITVKAVSQLSILLDLSTTILGLSLTALATSLPELVMTIVASTKHENKVVVGTLIGSNLFNLTLFPAIVFLFTGVKSVPQLELLMLAGITLIFFVVVMRYRGKVLPFWIGGVLLALYACFLYTNFQTIS